MSADIVERLAARVLLVDASDRVLLFRGFDPGDRTDGPWWITPGGGLEPGEDALAGAARELFEETGLRLDAGAFTGPVHREVVEFPFDGRQYRQSQDFYLVRVDRWEVDTRGFTPVELRAMDQHRWWSIAELRDTAEQIYPECLAELLAGLLATERGGP
jgi:8-oxo-dGTP pyrophosphatase MutT (NUDIX family)